MQKTRSIKWGLAAIMLILAVSVCAACTGSRIAPNGNLNYGAATPNIGLNTSLNGGVDNAVSRVIEGYIVGFDNNRITIEEVELLTDSHTSRINELGLDSADFRDGYYIHNDGSRGRATYPLANNVQVRFAQASMDGYGVREGVAYNGVDAGLNNTVGIDGTGAEGMFNGAGTNTTGNTNTPGYTPNNVNTNTTTGFSNTLRHIGHTLGGAAGGVVGGVEMLTNRFRNGGLTMTDRTPFFITVENGYVTVIEEVRSYSNFAGTATGEGTRYNTVNNTAPTTIK